MGRARDTWHKLRARRESNIPQARFEALLARHRGIVYKVANTFCRDEEGVRDLAQIVAQLWRASPSFDDSRTFSTWINRIALNVAISQRPSSGRRFSQDAIARFERE